MCLLLLIQLLIRNYIIRQCCLNFRCLRSSFDPEGQRIILQEEVGGPDVLVVDDVTSLNWPKELSLTMQEKLVGGSNTVVFMLRPSQ